ncbi:uncharacterized protein [Epargyreus clarus]|uniref:uncharacterized protein n=1 Tax=Epargyreus clarus TaxID=520877 RepID=UPI003C2B3A5D
MSTLHQTLAYWDTVSTTLPPHRTDKTPRQSFFRWQIAEWEELRLWFHHWDWIDISNRRHLHVIAGISIDFVPLGTAVIMNRRILITSANFIDPHMHRQRDLRIWALGRGGLFNTPYRYRVWRVWRLFPRSNNPEHQHGPRGTHVPRHDICIIYSWDQIYIYPTLPARYQYAYRSYLTSKHMELTNKITFAGSGFEYLEHVKENYKIFYAEAFKREIVDCSKYLPKWWGKFICVKNVKRFSGVPNGGGLFAGNYLVGLGCFEIRYNEDRIMVFTDLRYYVTWIYAYADIWPGLYYEYAYPEWSVKLDWLYDGHGNHPFIPAWQVQGDLYPLGR